jgi:hypothetical protein
MITPTSYNGHVYRLILTDEATHARYGYTFKEKNEAYGYIKNFITLIDTQYSKKIKVCYIDGGREYSLSQL